MVQPTRIVVLHSLTDRGGGPSARLRLLTESVQEAELSFGTLSEALTEPGKVALTLDDGYDDLAQLQPWLAEQGITPTVFLPTAYLGKPNSWDHFLTRRRIHLSVEQVRELAAAGVEFGSHSHTHADLTALDSDRITEELLRSGEIIQELTGGFPRALAYPFGKHDTRAMKIAQHLGYKVAFLSSPGGNHQYAHGRTPIFKWDTPLTLRAKLTSNWLTPIENLKCQIVTAFSHLTPALRNSRN